VPENGNAAPLLVADFTQKFISQSTPNQAHINTLSLTIATRASLFSRPTYKTKISISGLRGSVTPSAELPIHGSGSSVFGETGDWTNSVSGGKLVLTVKVDTVAKYAYVVKINVTNPSHGQDSPQIEIEASGIMIASVGEHPPYPMCTCECGTNVM
jgi:hypothetical protein